MLEYFVGFSHLVGWGLKIYAWVHIAAFVLSWIHADPTNQIVSLVNRVTIPMWNWVSQRVPGVLSPLAPFIALMLVIFSEIALPGIIRSLGAALGGNMEMEAGLKNMVFYLLYGGLYVTANIIWFVFFLSILWFVFTLVNPPMNNPIIRSIMYIIDPLITPLQRILPRARIDLSPLVLAVIAFFLRDIIIRIMTPIQAGIII